MRQDPDINTQGTAQEQYVIDMSEEQINVIN
jgi:hypothetical protein